MTEQCVNQQTSQEDARKWNRAAARHEDGDGHSDPDDCHRYTRAATELVPGAEHEQQEPAGRRKPALVRSKTFDHSMLTQVKTDSDSKIERKKSQYSQLSKGNCQYHKIFKEISKEEQLRQSYTCALQKDILYQGRMFVSDHWICFHSKVFGKDTKGCLLTDTGLVMLMPSYSIAPIRRTKIAIPVVSVSHIKKTKTAILVPNALVIATANDRYVFVSFLSRDNTYKFLMSVCLHLEEKSPCSSPIPSSAESSFRAQRSHLPPHFPLSFPVDFTDLDGAVRQRRQEMEESSSSDSQTPDYDKITDFPVPPFLDVLKHGDGAAPPAHPLHQHKAKNQHQNQQSPDNKQHGTKSPGPDVLIDCRSLQPLSVKTLLLVYLMLVCVLVLSSCYLAIKVMSLEQRLSTLGSVSALDQQQDDVLRGGADVNAELFSELLSINLMKLEKVQKNLQRLLDEAA